MLTENILEQLVYFTDEEINNLNGMNIIDKSIYTTETSSIVDYEKLLNKEQQILIRKHTRFACYPKHRHNYIELTYVYSGHMEHIIDDRKIFLEKGDVILLNQSIEHAIEYTDENDIIFNFIIHPDFLEFLSMMLEKENDLAEFIFDALYSYDNNGEYLIFKSQNNNKVKDCIESIIVRLYEKELNTTLEVKLLVGLLMAELMNHPEQIETYTENTSEKIIGSSIFKYIATSYQEGSLSKLSQEINIPDYKICRIVKKLTGLTFKQLVQQQRLKVASQLLRATHIPIVDILQEVGYENVTYFYKIFKKEYNMTPNEYRESSLNAK